ncbi:hypothetical protein ARMGADRAFT_292515 [Armillaria gallica]|uniref:Uncharacterized protein n=1 Tax=Armillaria gallica TaxID=47427 RepID=A0A2H3D6A0_ARMGA|nr:hypothetical protein ARMGADRAFT_292515 [Armillaria gallica]
MAVFKTMEESRSNDSLGTSFRTVRRGQSNVDGDGDALRIYTRAVLWARTVRMWSLPFSTLQMGVAESSSSFYSPSNKPSDVSYHVSTLSKFWISFLRRYELGTMQHVKKTHICVYSKHRHPAAHTQPASRHSERPVALACTYRRLTRTIVWEMFRVLQAPTPHIPQRGRTPF